MYIRTVSYSRCLEEDEHTGRRPRPAGAARWVGTPVTKASKMSVLVLRPLTASSLSPIRLGSWHEVLLPERWRNLCGTKPVMIDVHFPCESTLYTMFMGAWKHDRKTVAWISSYLLQCRPPSRICLERGRKPVARCCITRILQSQPLNSLISPIPLLSRNISSILPLHMGSGAFPKCSHPQPRTLAQPAAASTMWRDPISFIRLSAMLRAINWPCSGGTMWDWSIPVL